jgi:methylthioribose-1-phosphate isomerase
MRVGEREYRSIWQDEKDIAAVRVIDQRTLPFSFDILALRSADDVCMAITEMAVRGAPLIGAAAAWGVYLSYLEHAGKDDPVPPVLSDAARLKATRPTAVNLAWAVDSMTEEIMNIAGMAETLHATSLLRKKASDLCDAEAERCRQIGLHGLSLIWDASRRKNSRTVNILTHCNAGWLACVDYGTALAPVYMAHDSGIDVHVWVDETRPRNQGSRLTAWELMNHGVPCTLITDNAGGHLMQTGKVDMVIVGCDRATAGGDVANKTGTYLKALAAYDNGIPFYSAFPVSTFDLAIDDPSQIPIEERDGEEVRKIEGLMEDDAGKHFETLHATSLRVQQKPVYICQPETPVSNYGFDITPARLITAIITDRGICNADKESIKKLLS